MKQDNTGKLAVTAQAAVHVRGHLDQSTQSIFATGTSGHGRPYDALTSGQLVAMHHPEQSCFLQQQQLPFNLPTSGASYGFIPASANNYIQQIHLPTVNYNQHRGFIEQQYIESPIINAEQQQWRNPPSYIPAPILER